MRNDIKLYIDGQLADCDPSTLILLNYTREELDAPVVIHNSYSQSVILPATPQNNAIFGRVFRNDRITTPASFNPLKRLGFAIYKNEGEILESGYCKLTQIATRGRDIYEYAVTLYGGLGDFFAALDTTADGEKLTLADMAYWWTHPEEGDGWYNAEDIDAITDAASISGIWSELITGGTPLLAYVPSYNGIPEDFAADKAILRASDFNNIPETASDGTTTYRPWDGTGGAVLVDIGREVTEWEVQDLRSYLQRPALSIVEFFRAIVHHAAGLGYNVVLDPAYFTTANSEYMNAYYTLSLLDRKALAADGRTVSEAMLADYLAQSISPADLLLSYAKQNGLVFLHDPAARRIDILARDTFYSTGLDAVDLSGRIDRNGAEVTPVLAGAHWYEFANDEVYGDAAEKYKERTGKALGSIRLNTGWEFDRETENIMETVRFKGAANVKEGSTEFAYYFNSANNKYAFKFGKMAEPTVQLWNGAHTENIQVPLLPFKFDIVHTYAQTAQYEDYFAKPQFHGEDNAAQDGAGVIVVYSGAVTLPDDDTDDSALELRISNDSTIMDTLAGGPCWDCRRTGILLTKIPRFEWREWPAIYEARWKAYLTDRYNVDTRVMRCRVDLAGLKVDAALLRRFFIIDGVRWVLNKIMNHSLTTYDLTECEFVRVQDTENYTDGQTI